MRASNAVHLEYMGSPRATLLRLVSNFKIRGTVNNVKQLEQFLGSWRLFIVRLDTAKIRT